MSLSLKFSSDVISRFTKVVTSNEVAFNQSSSVKLVQPGIVATVDVTENIDENFPYSEFYFKGWVSLPNEPSCDVVVKILFGNNKEFYSETRQSYIQEAEFYRDHLCGNKSLYGKAVPKIYGLYETKITWKQYDALVDCACMVYQYYGSTKDLPWSTGSGLSDFGLQAAKFLLEMHKSGIIHNSVDLDTNIACLDDKPFFINFSQACKHVCPDKDFEFPARLFDIDADDLGCSELSDFLGELRHRVAPLFFHWYGYDVHYDWVKSLDNIFQRARRTTFGKRATVEEQWKHAVDVWKFLCANWSSYHTGKAPEVGDTSYEAYRARCDSGIVYSDDEYEYEDYSSEDEE